MSDDIVAISGNPNWLADVSSEDSSMESLAEHRILPRVKVIQSLSEQSLKDQFGEGAAILAPGNGLACKRGEYFDFVPLFFFNEFIKWADLNDSGSPSIMERTFDAASPTAIKARNPANREEDYGQGFTARYQEHLNYCGVIYGDSPLAGTACVLGFTRGEFYKGKEFASALFLRKVDGKQAPLWSMVWRFMPAFREKGSYKWFGLDFCNPPEGSLYIKEDDATPMREEHLNLRKEFENRKLAVDLTETTGETTGESTEM